MNRLHVAFCLTLILAVVLPPGPSLAMFGKDAVRRENNDDDNSDDDQGKQPARVTTTTRSQQSPNPQLRAALTSAAVQAMEDDPELAKAMAASLRDQKETFGRLLSDDELAQIEKDAAAAQSSSSSSASSSASASTAAMASESAAAAVRSGGDPSRRARLQRGAAVKLSEEAASIAASPKGALSAHTANLPKPEYRELGRQEDQLALIDQLGRAGTRKATAVQAALLGARDTLSAVEQQPVGQIPRDLAIKLVALADTEGGIGIVRALSLDGIRQDPQARAFLRSLRHVEKLDTLIKAAESAANARGTDAGLAGTLRELARNATEQRNRVDTLLQHALGTYPEMLATVRLTDDALGNASSAGRNAAPMPLSYDFVTGIATRHKFYNAMFKEDAQAKVDPGLGLDVESTQPHRLMQRAVATRQVAELLGVGDLVVNTRIAVVEGAGANRVGVVMEIARGAAGQQPAVRTAPPASELAAFRRLESLHAEATAMLQFLSDGGQGAWPPTPNYDALKGPTATWDAGQWRSDDNQTRGRLASSRVKRGDAGAALPFYVEEEQRLVTDEQLADPDLRRQMSNAQWLDLLCGQIDRHMGNMFFDTSVSPPVVKLIDNDLSFPANNADVGLDTAQATPKFRLPRLPTTIDKDLRAKLMAITDRNLRVITDGLLTDAEQTALSGRLTMLQGYLASGGVISVSRPGQAGTGEIDWMASADTLFIGTDSPSQTDPASYFAALMSYPAR